MSFIKQVKNNYVDDDCIKRVFNYCARIDDLKDLPDMQWGGHGICTLNRQSVIDSMMYVKNFYGKTEGVQLYHFVISFYRKNFNYNNGLWCDFISNEVSFFIYSEGYQNYYFKHTDTDYIHLHIIVNSVNYITGKKLSKILGLERRIYSYLKKNYSHLKWEGIY